MVLGLHERSLFDVWLTSKTNVYLLSSRNSEGNCETGSLRLAESVDRNMIEEAADSGLTGMALSIEDVAV